MGAASHTRQTVYFVVPGLLVSILLAMLAIWVGHMVSPSGPLVLAFAVGLVAAPLIRRMPSHGHGTAFAATTVLRCGIALLGFQISLSELSRVGVSGLATALITMAVTLAVTLWLARRLRVVDDLAAMIAVGTAVCGASAIAALSSVVSSREDSRNYAVSTITLCGTIAMFAVPLLGRHVLGLSEHDTSVWVGASLHEVAQVAVAGAAVSAAGLETATLVKLVRVATLAPAVMATRAAMPADERGANRPKPIPWFVGAFVALILLRSVLPVPDSVVDFAKDAATWLIAVALVGLGLQVKLGDLRAEGPRPLALGVIATLVATGTALLAVLVL